MARTQKNFLAPETPGKGMGGQGGPCAIIPRPRLPKALLPSACENNPGGTWRGREAGGISVSRGSEPHVRSFPRETGGEEDETE